MSYIKHRLSGTQFPKKESSPPPTDWDKCALCQETKEDILRCPADSKRFDVGAGYATLGKNLLQFADLKLLPFNIARLDEGEGVIKTITNNKARWHKSCGLQYSNLKLQRAEKRKSCGEDEESYTSKKFTRQTEVQDQLIERLCFFCGNGASDKKQLHDVATFGLDKRVRESALELQDEKLLAKLSAGDLVAQEAKYHASCLVALYNNAHTSAQKAAQDSNDTIMHGIALAELLNYIEDARLDADVAPVFKLGNLAKLYTQKLESLGVDVTGRVHTTRLKERIQHHFPDLQSHKEGRDILLAFDCDVSIALRKVCEESYDDERVHLAKTAQILRREMLEKELSFKGSFHSGCQKDSVPRSLLVLVRMILEGPNIPPDESEDALSQTALSIAQLLLFNCHIRRREGSCSISHLQKRETPLPLYLGVMIHAKTRKREIVETLYDLGLSVSYQRVLAVSTEEGNHVCEQFKADKVVCPPKLRYGLTTGGEIDNIDHDPSSTTAKDSFHGTSISLSQQPTVHKGGRERRRVEVENKNSTSLEALPQAYINVPPLVLKHKEPPIPALNTLMQVEQVMQVDAINEEKM